MTAPLRAELRALSDRIAEQRRELARLNKTVEEWTKGYYTERALNAKLGAGINELAPVAEISDARQDTIDALNERCSQILAENARLRALLP